jgi:hypothetical protein
MRKVIAGGYTFTLRQPYDARFCPNRRFGFVIPPGMVAHQPTLSLLLLKTGLHYGETPGGQKGDLRWQQNHERVQEKLGGADNQILRTIAPLYEQNGPTSTILVARNGRHWVSSPVPTWRFFSLLSSFGAFRPPFHFSPWQFPERFWEASSRSWVYS